MRKGNSKGFTLIELLLVILIITGLAAIVVPNYMKVSDESSIAVDDANQEALRAATRLLVLDAGLTDVAAGGNINSTLGGPDLADFAGTYIHGPYIEGGIFPVPPATIGSAYTVDVAGTTGAITIVVVP